MLLEMTQHLTTIITTPCTVYTAVKIMKNTE